MSKKENPKTPASRMVRVSTPLINLVQKLCDLHRAGHTEEILKGLEALISNIENNIAASYLDSDLIADILRRLDALEAAAGDAKQPEPTQAPITQPKPEPTQAPKKQSKPKTKRAPVEPSVEPRVEKTIPKLPKLYCPKCNSTDLRRWGHDKNGTRQRYKCSNCGRQFFK